MDQSDCSIGGSLFSYQPRIVVGCGSDHPEREVRLQAYSAFEPEEVRHLYCVPGRSLISKFSSCDQLNCAESAKKTAQATSEATCVYREAVQLP